MTGGGTRRRPTSADVAREAGLSRATVSYVLNDTPHQTIPEATRRRVLEAAARLGYAPSAAARALRSGRSDVVLCLLPDWPIGPAVGDLLSHLSGALAEQGLTLLAHPRARRRGPVADGVEGDHPRCRARLRRLRRRGGRGHARRRHRAHGRPARPVAAARQRARAPRAAHRTAAGGAPRRPGPPAARVRLPRRRAGRRLRAAAPRRRALPVRRPRASRSGRPHPPARPRRGGDAVRAGGAEDPAVTAVCAYNDDVALAVLAGMHRLALTAPGDLAVIGVDDIPAAALAVPPSPPSPSTRRALARACRPGRRLHARRHAAAAPAGLRRGAGHRARVRVSPARRAPPAAPPRCGHRAVGSGRHRPRRAPPRRVIARAGASGRHAAPPPAGRRRGRVIARASVWRPTRRARRRPGPPPAPAVGSRAVGVAARRANRRARQGRERGYGGEKDGPRKPPSSGPAQPRRRGRPPWRATANVRASTVATSVPPSRTVIAAAVGAHVAAARRRGRRRAAACRDRCTRRSPRPCPARG